MEAAGPDAAPRAVPSVEYLPVKLDGRQAGHLTVATAGERDEWEMHPDQDEFLYLLEGAVDVFLRTDLELDNEETVKLRQGQACVVPQGTWHRQVVVAPCKMLFLTPQTLHRSYVPDRGWITPTGS